MKIVHICLACFYVEGMGYQENLMPVHHILQGNEVYVITSDYSFDKHGKITRKTQSEYTNLDGIRVKVLTRDSGILGARLGKYIGLYNTLSSISPDIIFVHGAQFASLIDVVKYIKRNRHVKMYIDQHADYYNSPVKTIKQKILQNTFQNIGA